MFGDYVLLLLLLLSFCFVNTEQHFDVVPYSPRMYPNYFVAGAVVPVRVAVLGFVLVSFSPLS